MLKSLKGKIILVVTIFVVVLVAGISFYSYNQSADILRETIFTDAVYQAQNNAALIEDWLTGIETQVKTLERTPSVQSMNWSGAGNMLKSVADDYEHIIALYIADRTGEYEITSGGSGSIADRDYFQEAMATGNTVISQPIISKASGRQIIVVGTPIKTDGNIKGFLGTTIDIQFMQELVENMNISGHGFGWIIDKNMNTVAHPEDSYLGNKEILQDGNQQLRDIAAGMAAGESGTSAYTLNGVQKQLVYAPVELTGWSVGIGADVSQVLAPLDVIRNGSLVAGVIAVILGAVIAYFIAGYLSKPVIAVARHAGQVADGDLTSELEDKYVKRSDEVGNLAGAINKMTDTLREMIQKIKEISQQVAASSEELSASGQQVGETAEQVGGAIQDVASGAEEQSAQLEETTDSVENIIDQIEKVSENSGQMNKAADRVMDNIEEGNRALGNSIDEINNVREETSEIAGIIQSLGKASEEIGDIVEIINGIASQTNLLALNAAIEAARAGEAGRGFSVVADEIRELAEESTASTEKIAGLIKDIQNGVSDAVTKMEENRDTVNDSVHAIEENEEVFRRIREVALNLEQLIEKVAGNAGELEENSKKVERAVNEIAAVSDEAAGNAEEVAASSEEQIASTEEIASGARDLAEMAEKLARTVDQFKT